MEEHKLYHDNGTLAAHYFTRDGLVNGLLKTWYPNGQCERENNYKNGKEDGLCKAWDVNGKLIYFETFLP